MFSGSITKDDVRNIFTNVYPGNEWVLDGKYGNSGWFSNKNFDTILNVFNTRKNLLITKGLDQFIANTYNTVYERFYLNFPYGSGISIADADGFYSLVVPRPSLADFGMWMDIDAAGLYYDLYPTY